MVSSPLGDTFMTTLNVSVPEEMKAFIEAQIAAGAYGSVSEFVRALIHDAQKRQARQELEAKLLEGLQGATAEMTAAEWDSIEEEARERYVREQRQDLSRCDPAQTLTA